MKKQLICAWLMGATCATFAAEASPWSFRVGVTQFTPHVSSGDLSAPSLSGTKATFDTDTQLSWGINYKLNDQWSVDVPLGLPFEHDIKGAGAIQGVGKLGSVKVLPFTVLMQYQLNVDHPAIHPYLGAGLTYAKFYGGSSTGVLTAITGGTAANPTTLRVESQWAPSIQLGVKFNLTQAWHMDVNYMKTYLSTQAKLSTGQTLDATLNPSAVSIGFGRSF